MGPGVRRAFGHRLRLSRADPERAIREREHRRRKEAERTRAQGPQLGERGSQEQDCADQQQRRRRDPARAPDGEPEGDREAVADAATVPPAVEHEGHEDPQGTQREPQDVALGL